ncbi:MAG: TlpA family protein disulfide reductase [Thermoguttaceae bacterium]
MLNVILCVIVASATWFPAEVPGNSASEFLSYYQQFLRERLPRPLRFSGESDAARAERRQNNTELAATMRKLATTCERLSHDPSLPAATSTPVRREAKNRVGGTWNLDRQSAPNRLDLWLESRYLLLQALQREIACADTEEQIVSLRNEMNSLAKSLAECPSQPGAKCATCELYQATKRALTLTAFDVRIAERIPPREEVLLDTLNEFDAFLRQYANRDNIGVIENMLAFIERFPLARIGERLASLFPAWQKCVKQEDRELVSTLEGVLRRQNLIGKPLEIVGVDTDGNVFDASSLDGKVVILDFWATWCGPCIAEFPHLEQLRKNYSERGLVIIGYSVDADTARLADYLREKPLAWRVLSKTDSLAAGIVPLSTYYGARKIPLVIVRDRDGNTILVNPKSDELDAMIEKLCR